MSRGVGWLLLLLVLTPSAGPWLGPAAAQGNATAPPAATPPGTPAETPFEALPPELRAEAFTWLDETNATIAAFNATHPEVEATVLWLFRDGAWDFLNESRLGLAESQLFQIHVQVTFEAFFPGLAEAERRNATLARAREETDRSQAAVDAFLARLRDVEARLHTAPGLEYATLAASTFVIADQLVRSAPNATQQVLEAPEAEPRLVRGVLAVAAGPQAFVRFADGLLDLAVRADAAPGALPLAANATAVLADRIGQRLARDTDASSTTGPQSAEAQALLDEAARSNITALHLARFAAFEQARTVDAMDFRHERGTLSDAVLSSNLRAVTENASWLPRYDGNLDLNAGPPLAQQVRAAGFAGLLGVNAHNHAVYRLQWDSVDGVARYEGAKAAWAEAVAARYAGEMLREVPVTRPAAADGDLLLYGGVAVAAAAAVIAFATLRKR